MARYAAPRRHIAILGAFFPAVLVWLAGFIVAGSIVVAATGRGGALGILQAVPFVPALVARGELWRLVTWCFFELDPLGLIFSVLILAFLGRDLVQAWGPARFLGFYAGIGVAAALCTTVMSLAWTDLQTMRYLSAWPVVEGVTVAWATLFPSRQLLLYFVLPVSGRTLVALTVAGTAIFALLSGVAYFVPHFAAIAAALLYVRGFNSLLVRWKMSRLLKAQRRPSHLRAVEKKKGNGQSDWLH